MTDGVCDGICDGVWLFGKDSFEECPLTGHACVLPVLSCAVATCVVVFNAFFGYVVPALALQASNWFFSSFFDHAFFVAYC